MARAVPASVALAAALALAPAAAPGQEPGGLPEPPAAGAAPAERTAARPDAPAPTPRDAATPGSPARPAPAPGEPGFLDTSHAAVEEQLRDVVDWLDRLFGDRRFLEFGPQRSTVRWRSEVRLTDEPRAYPHTTALVDLRLPAATAWLARAHLVLSGDRVADGEGAPGGDGPAAELAAGQGRLELRYDLFRQPGSLAYLGGGIRFAWPPDPFVRFRVRQDLALARTLLARFTPSFFWELSHGFGATMQLDLDQAVSSTAVLRGSAGMLVHEKSRGSEWGTSLELRAPLPWGLLGALGGSVNGVERSPVPVEKYRTYARLRADLFRHWLFAEIEPEVVWPADPPRGYRTVAGVILRLEVLFVSEAAPAPREPAAPGEAGPRAPAPPDASPAPAPGP